MFSASSLTLRIAAKTLPLRRCCVSPVKTAASEANAGLRPRRFILLAVDSKMYSYLREHVLVLDPLPPTGDFVFRARFLGW